MDRDGNRSGDEASGRERRWRASRVCVFLLSWWAWPFVSSPTPGAGTSFDAPAVLVRHDETEELPALPKAGKGTVEVSVAARLART